MGSVRGRSRPAPRWRGSRAARAVVVGAPADATCQLHGHPARNDPEAQSGMVWKRRRREDGVSRESVSTLAQVSAAGCWTRKIGHHRLSRGATGPATCTTFPRRFKGELNHFLLQTDYVFFLFFSPFINEVYLRKR
uniref:Uncharacterized protein n=1 Tax=Ixodes ricinus TaxID=34613 RepID=A0A6B0US78_IXORI